MARIRPYYSIDPKNWALAPSAGVAAPYAQAQGLSLREWAANELVETYGYPRHWLGDRIRAVGSDPTAPGDELFGLSVAAPDGTPFLLVSIAESGDAGRAERKLRAALLRESVTGLGLATDGTLPGTTFLRRRFDSDKCDFVLDIEPYFQPGTAPTPQPYLLHSEGLSQRSTARPELALLTERVENVFYEAHSHIRDIDGFHADEALDELCKILYAKLYDERSSHDAETYTMQRWLYGSTEEFATSLRSLYQRASAFARNELGQQRNPARSRQSVFGHALRLSSPALTRAAEVLQDYDITGSPTDIKGRAFQKVLNPAARAGMGQYFTPHPVIKLMVSAAHPRATDLILDPFCGSGHFLTTCLNVIGQSAPAHERDHMPAHQVTGLHGIEKSDRMVRVAMTDMLLHGDGHTNIRCTDSLLAFTNYPDLIPESFDLILTNPPFGSILGQEALSMLGHFELSRGHKAVPLEVLGLERCLQFLRPGGRLGIVLPDGLLANRSARYVREWLESKARICAVVSLPIETFQPFGAAIKTSVLFARKWRLGENRASDYPVLMVRVDNVGYDASGRARDGCDLDKSTKELSDFLLREGW